jgi:uncharacterized protein
VRIADKIIVEALRLRDVAVSGVWVGRKYTAVVLANGAAGVALTQPADWFALCADELSQSQRLELEGTLQAAEDRARKEHTSHSLVAQLASGDPIEAAAGLACVNALANRPHVGTLPGDLLDHLEVRPTDAVAMIGYFAPLVAPLSEQARMLHIFERQPREGALPAERAYDLLPDCDIAIITAGTLSNGSIDPLLRAAAPCREVALVGASTPLLPAAFLDTPVTWLSGSVVIDVEQTVKAISAGGGRREFSRYLRKGNLPCERRL